MASEARDVAPARGAGEGAAEAREAAIRRLKERRDFSAHLVTYVVVNALLIVIWAVTGSDTFWPVWPIAGWGVGLVLHFWTVFLRRPITETDIRREMERSGR